MTHESSLDGAPHGPMTVEEWAELPEDTPGELVNGWLVQDEMPDFVHEALVAQLLEVLREGLTLDLDALWAEIDDLERARKKS